MKAASPLVFLSNSKKKLDSSSSTASKRSSKSGTTTETRQDDKSPTSKLDSTSKQPTEEDERQDQSDDSSTDSSSTSSSSDDEEVDMDKLSHQLHQTQTQLHQTQLELTKWEQIFQTQRHNLTQTISTYQQLLLDATKSHHEQYEDGIQSWKNRLKIATSNRDEEYERGLKRWRYELENAHLPRDYAQVKQLWDRLEISRHAPTKEMKHATEKLRRLQETVNLPSKEMKEAKKMVEELTAARDAPMKEMSLSRKEKKYVKNVMKWQDALVDATTKHEKDCTKWAQTLDESKDSKEMKRVRRMLNRLLDTRGVPTGDMEEASEMLQRLESEKDDAHLIVLRYAGSQVYRLEREVMRMKEEMNEMKKVMGNREDFIAWENSMDGSFSDEEEEEEEGGDWFGFGSSFNLFGIFDKGDDVGGDNSVSVTSASVMSS